MNTFNITGHLCGDAKVITNKDGSLTALMTVGVRQSFARRDGNVGTDFVPVSKYFSAQQVAEGRTKLIGYLKKGRLVSVSGSIQSYTVSKPDGTTAYGFKLQAGQIDLLDANKAANKAADAAGAYQAPVAQAPVAAAPVAAAPVAQAAPVAAAAYGAPVDGFVPCDGTECYPDLDSMPL